MSMIGPRLDRPTAVGDEGRPRAASQTVAALVTVVVAGLTFVVWGAVGQLTLVALAGATFVAGLGLLGRSGIAAQTVGHVTYHVGALAVVAMVAVALSGSSQALALGGVFFALVGVAGTWANALERDAIATASRTAARSYVAALLWLVVLLAVLIVLTVAWQIVEAVLGARSPSQSLIGMLGVLTLVGLVVRLACWAVPVAPLAPDDRTDAYRAATVRVGRGAVAVACVAFVGIIVVGLVGPGRLNDFGTANPVALAGFAALSSAPVVLGVASVAGLAGLAVAVGVSVRWAAARLDAGNYDTIAAAIAGFVVTGVVVVAAVVGPIFLPILAAIVVVLALFAPLATIVVGFLVVGLVDWGVIPRRAAGPAVAAAGLLVVAIGAALGHLPSPLVFACVAGAMVAWDCGTFGLGLTIELGHRPHTRRLELYHGVLSVGVGVLVVVVASVLELFRRSALPAVGAWPAVGLAVLGALLLALAVRRREA